MKTNELEFLKHLYKCENHQALCKRNPPLDGIMKLVSKGFCKLSRAVCGPLYIPTGEVFVILTEAGKAYLEDTKMSCLRNI